MPNLVANASAGVIACLCLTGCITKREHVLAPSTAGVVINAETGKPVKDAQVRYVGLEGSASVITGPDGRFTLEGLTDNRTIVALPVSGVFRDATTVRASAPDMAEGYASAAFINGGKPAQALYNVTVLMFPADAGQTALHALTRDCIEGPEQDHALHLAAYAGGIDPGSPPEWLDQDAAEALHEHLWLTLPASGFRPCEQMTAAYEMFRSQTERLQEIFRSRSTEVTP
jgi:hypothetical protein